MKNTDISVTLGLKIMIKDKINNDIKTAMLAGEKERVTILRGLKSAILYAEVAKGSREDGLPENEVIAILQKEAKKRQESADLYRKGGNNEKARVEEFEKELIVTYLPVQLTEEEIREFVKREGEKLGELNIQQMGKLISAVKIASGGNADGAIIAREVREFISK